MRSFLLLTGLSVFVGCSGDGGQGGVDRPDTAPTKITIKYNGSPVEGATVTLSPKAPTGGTAASGKTDGSGSATMNAFNDKEGVVPGDYKVLVVKTDASASSGAVDVDDPNYDGAPEAEEAEEDSAPKSLIPEKYNSAAGSDLEAKVEAGKDNDFSFELKD